MTISDAQRDLCAGLIDLPLTETQRQEVARRAAAIMAPTDDMLVDEVRKLVRRAMEEGFHILDRGSPTMKLRLISAVFGRLVSLIGQEQPTDLGEIRADMDKLLRLVRDEDAG